MAYSLVLDDYSVGYGGRRVLCGVSLRLEAGRLCGILGANGSGKTTLLKSIARLQPALGGSAEVCGKPLQSYRPSTLAKKLAVVLTVRPQLENTTAFDVASMGRYPYTGFFGSLSGLDREKTLESLRLCGAGTLCDKAFDTLSDGEKQKVLIARGLAQDPQLLLLDEPTSHLDVRHKLEILAALKALCARTGKTVVCTLHEPDLAVKCCDDLVLVHQGRTDVWGPAAKVARCGGMDRLYGLRPHQFDPVLGTVEFTVCAQRDVFLYCGGEEGAALLRRLAGAGLGLGLAIPGEGDICRFLGRAMGAPIYLAGSEEAQAAARTYRQIAYQQEHFPKNRPESAVLLTEEALPGFVRQALATKKEDEAT